MAITYESEAPTRSGPTTGGRRAARGGKPRDPMVEILRRRAAAFSAARRHTWFVRFLKFLFPLVALGGIGIYALLLSGGVKLKLGPGTLIPGKIEVTAEDLKMKNLSYFGVTKDGGRYDVRAKEAAVDFAQTGPVRLDFIDGDLIQQSGVVTKIKSRRGNLDNKKGEMELFDGVEIDASNGMRARLRSAKVFNKDHRVVSNEPIIAELPTGRIQANGMEFETKSRKGFFAGNVTVRLVQSETPSGKANMGLGKDARAPIDVRSQRLDIDDSTKLANFTGGVTAVQGESTLQSSTLKVLYEGKSTLPGQAPVPTESGEAARVSKLQAAGNVIIVAGLDRRVISDAVDFDVKADTALFVGAHVELTQGKNRLIGRRLFLDRKAGRSRLDAPAEGRTPAGRIQTTFVPSAADGKPKAIKAAPAQGGEGGIANFRTDPNAPMDIEADTLDVNDPTKQAIYRGAVRAQQGDFTIQAQEIVANYIGDTGIMSGGETPAAKGQGAQISKIDAKTKVVITSKDGQEATGDWASFDVKANTVLLGGAVVVKRGRDELKGARLRVDTVSGEARFENEPGTAALAPVMAPMTRPKSAAAPGGLPEILPAQPAPQAPTGNDCPPGRQCIKLFPEDHKKGPEKKVEKVKPKIDGWQPSSSPSPVYRSQ
jgi:lipopolysaccharide export system protein LptA